jgi:hypothetical protein
VTNVSLSQAPQIVDRRGHIWDDSLDSQASRNQLGGRYKFRHCLQRRRYLPPMEPKQQPGPRPVPLLPLRCEAASDGFVYEGSSTWR